MATKKTGDTRSRAATPAAKQDWKPIIDAAFAGSATDVAALLAAGADPNQRSPNSHRHTPLVRAVEWKKTQPRTAGHRAVVEVLLKAGADPMLSGGYHRWTPLAHAAMSDEAGLVDALRPHCTIDLLHGSMLYDTTHVKRALKRDAHLTDPEGRNALHYLAASGLHRRLGTAPGLAIASLLLDAGVDVNAAQTNLTGEDGWRATPLWWAVGWQDNEPLAQRLLEAGANPNYAINAATFDGSASMLELLFQHGADVEHRVDGSTVLLAALGFRRSQHLDTLLARGADPNARDAAGNNALHVAVKAGVRPEVITRLLAAGADASATNAAGATPRALARRLGRAALEAALAPSRGTRPRGTRYS